MDEDTASSGKSFDQKLRDARIRQGLDPKPPEPGRAASDAAAIAVVFRVSAELVSALVVGLAVGWALDHVLKTRPLFMILFVLLGWVAGIINVWRVMAPTTGITGRR